MRRTGATELLMFAALMWAIPAFAEDLSEKDEELVNRLLSDGASCKTVSDCELVGFNRCGVPGKSCNGGDVVAVNRKAAVELRALISSWQRFCNYWSCITWKYDRLDCKNGKCELVGLRRPELKIGKPSILPDADATSQGNEKDK